MAHGLITLKLSPRTQRRLRTVLRLTVLCFAILCLLAAALFWIATRSWVITRALEPHLEKRLGGEVVIGSAEYQGDGRVVFRDLVLRARGLDGLEGDITTIKQAAVTLDVRRLLSGRIRVTGVDVDHATLRISEDFDNNGVLNIWSLKPDWSGSNVRQAPTPFRVSIQNTAIEFGFHDHEGFHLLGSRLVSGEMRPTPGAPNLYSFFLSEIDETGAGLPEGINIKGEWDARTNEMSNRIDGIELNERVYRMCPRMVRVMWESMNLEGKVQSVEMHWNPNQSFLLQMDIENVALTLPVETNIEWARYRDGNVESTTARPRMRFNSGTIRMTNESLELIDMIGALGSADQFDEVVEVPYRISFTLPKLQPLEWEEREKWVLSMLKFAPYSLQYTTEDLRLVRDWRGEAPAIDLPIFIANVLARFKVSDCELTTTLDVTRPEATRDEAGNMVSPNAIFNGTAYLHNASGRYQKFPYRLENVDAYLQFDNEKVTVHYLTGTGAGDSKMRIWGEIKPPDNDAAVALRLTGTNVPVDDRLRDALQGNELAAFDMMFNKAAHDSMAAAGRLPDSKAIEQAALARDAAKQQVENLRSTAGSDPAAIAELESEILRLTRFIEAGPFQLGGAVDIDLNIEREAGRGRKTALTGLLTVRNVGLLYDRFPYPLRVTSGVLDWRRDRVVIQPGTTAEGLTLITPGGGYGTATGELVFHKDVSGGKFLPNLQISIRDDAFNDAVYAAIPLTSSERRALTDASQWPGRVFAKAAQFVRGLGLRGSADYEGLISADADRRINYNFLVSLNQCTSQPTGELARLVGAHAPLWAPDFTIKNVQGTLEISRDAVKINRITGAAEECDLNVAGAINMKDGKVENLLNIQLNNLPLHPNVLNLASGGELAKLNDTWRLYEPQGHYDVTLEYQSQAEGESSIDALLVPRTLSVLMNGSERASLKRRSGDIRVRNGSVEFRDVLMDIENAQGVAEGSLSLGGTTTLKGEAKEFALTGAIAGARLEAPYVKHLLDVAGSDKVALAYANANPVGLFDATFEAAGKSGEAAHWELDITPRSAAFQWNKRPVLATFNSGTITADAKRIVVKDLRGLHSEGEFSLDGVINYERPLQAELTISHEGRVRSDFVEAFLPSAAIALLDHMTFMDFGPTIMRDATLRINERSDDSGKHDVSFMGPIQTTSASLNPGVQFHGINGTFHFNAFASAGRLEKLDIEASAKSAEALGQALSSVQALITVDEGAKIVRMPHFRAESEDGVIAATTMVQTQQHGEYSLNIDLVDVPLNRLGKSREAEPASGADASPSGKGATGDLYANLSLSGRKGDPESRTGRGVVRVMHGKMVNVPLIMQLMQVVQLSVPLAGNLDFADAQMYVQGDRVVFERILFESTMGNTSMLQLFGEGEMNFETMELNTRFRSRGSTPILRDIMGEIGDVLYCIEVTGPLSDPKARIVPLPTSN